MKKFKMELVWHNCETYPPKEFSNNALIVTNGSDVLGMSWHRAEGYFVAENECCLRRLDNLENWWWADIKQTVQNDLRFQGFVDDLDKDLEPLKI
jgi:hypothetical protein